MKTADGAEGKEPDEETSGGRDRVDFKDLPSEDSVDLSEPKRLAEAVLHATDWTTETIISQLRRGNIDLNPKFQRRDAWTRPKKSRFIESIILGLPIPQIVLAELSGQRGKFIVLDGKQRLLSLLQFWGLGGGANNAYRLSGLNVLEELKGRNIEDLESVPALEGQLTALLNQPIRTVVIRNWPSVDFLHLVFLRLNTGSVKLSPQELRQAMFSGPFTDYGDDSAAESGQLQLLLNNEGPDQRMRDVELLARYLAFRLYLTDYRGRMRRFLDKTFERLNSEWSIKEAEVSECVRGFEEAVAVLIEVLGEKKVARKPGSRSFNRAIFDALVFYASDSRIRDQLRAHSEQVCEAYGALFEYADFTNAIERDTAGLSNTVLRLQKCGQALAGR
jgi:hypothetical protein